MLSWRSNFQKIHADFFRFHFLYFAEKWFFSRRCNGRKIIGPIGIDTDRVFSRRFRSLLFRVDARGTDSPYFYPFFSPFLSLSAPYFIVSRALRPLKRPDYKRPINSFILFALGASPSPASFLACPRKWSVVIPTSHCRSFFSFWFTLRVLFIPLVRFWSRSSSLIDHLLAKRKKWQWEDLENRSASYEMDGQVRATSRVSSQ